MAADEFARATQRMKPRTTVKRSIRRVSQDQEEATGCSGEFADRLSISSIPTKISCRDKQMENKPWPTFPFDEWKETCATLHMWTQVVGKIRLALSPWTNHSWHVTLYLTARGLTTSPIPSGPRVFQIQFDFIDHHLRMSTDDGLEKNPPGAANCRRCSIASHEGAEGIHPGRNQHYP